MNLKLFIQKQNYESLVQKYQQIEEIVEKRLNEEFTKSHIKLMQMPHRIKTWNSIEGKWAYKEDKYLKLEEMTDLLGFRIICYFSSQVDEAAEIIRRIFNVDDVSSCDKRILMSPTTFGYLSLHIICSLKNEENIPEELTELKFEIQLRSILQHAWAEIEHDLGYKSELEIPRDMRREFSRIAGLLEIADEAFDNIRLKLDIYEQETVERLKTDTADNMTLDTHTLNAFMKYSPAVEKLYSDMADITGGNVLIVGANGYLPILGILDISTLGDLYMLIDEERDHVLTLLRRALNYSDLEEITTNSALFYLCRARLIWGDYSEKDIYDIYYMLNDDRLKAERDTDMILRNRSELGLS